MAERATTAQEFHFFMRLSIYGIFDSKRMLSHPKAAYVTTLLMRR